MKMALCRRWERGTCVIIIVLPQNAKTNYDCEIGRSMIMICPSFAVTKRLNFSFDTVLVCVLNVP